MIWCMIWSDMKWRYETAWNDMNWYEMIWTGIQSITWNDMWYEIIWNDMKWYDMIRNGTTCQPRMFQSILRHHHWLYHHLRWLFERPLKPRALLELGTTSRIKSECSPSLACQRPGKGCCRLLQVATVQGVYDVFWMFRVFKIGTLAWKAYWNTGCASHFWHTQEHGRIKSGAWSTNSTSICRMSELWTLKASLKEQVKFDDPRH